MSVIGPSRRGNRRADALALGVALAALLWLASLASCHQNGTATVRDIVLLTTTTTQDSGILKALVDAFERRGGYRIKPIVAGSGDVLKQAASGEGDVVLTHSPDAEKEWMAGGFGTSRRLVMYNDFVIAGPSDDPASVRGASAVEALKKIYAAKAGFVSRGDQSGTHSRELKIWKQAGLQPRGQPWYRETGQGQGQTMDVASQQRAYCLTDRGTWLALREHMDLRLLVEGDPSLLNIYHVMTIDHARFPKANTEGGGAFAEFLLSPEGQRVIGDFGRDRFGVSLFTPAAGKKEEELLGVGSGK